MSSPEEFSTILEKYPPGFKIHLVHAAPSISPGDRSELSADELVLLQNFLTRIEDLRNFAKEQGISVVEVEEEEGNDYGARPDDFIVTAGCYGDMCVAAHTVFLKDNNIKAKRELALCLVL